MSEKSSLYSAFGAVRVTRVSASVDSLAEGVQLSIIMFQLQPTQCSYADKLVFQIVFLSDHNSVQRVFKFSHEGPKSHFSVSSNESSHFFHTMPTAALINPSDSLHSGPMKLETMLYLSFNKAAAAM